MTPFSHRHPHYGTASSFNQALAFAAFFAFATLPRPVLGADPNATTAAADPNRPRVLYRQAEAAFKEGNFERARQLLLEAWGIRRTYDVAAALGQAELELELFRDAAEHLDFAVQNFAPMESERLLEGTKADLRAAKSQVAEARITVNEPRAAVAANGQPLGESPLPAGLFLEPGTYDFEATLSPHRKATKRLLLQKGGTYDVELSLPPPSPASGRDAPAASNRLNYVPSIVAAAVGGAAVLTGAGLLFAAASKEGEREDLHSTLPGTNVCGAGRPVPASCEEISRLAWNASHYRTGALVAFGTALGAGIVSYLLWPSSPRERTAFVIAPAYSYESRSFDLSAVGRF